LQSLTQCKIWWHILAKHIRNTITTRMDTEPKRKGRKNLYKVVLLLRSVVLSVEERKVLLQLRAVPEKVNAAFSQPHWVGDFLVFSPSEGFEEGGPLRRNHNWGSNNACIKWWTPKIRHRHSRLVWVCDSPVSHAHKSSICHNLNTSNTAQHINTHKIIHFPFLYHLLHTKPKANSSANLNLHLHR